ncbi:MAG: 30S ribosomal protein S20 [Alphaproteobacteria bacterium]|nr:30S ribosomal protein S20 [Alphaproteobacteria bacterium]
MAHHKSAKKRIRQTVRRTEVNRSRVSRIRTIVKRFELAAAGGDKDAAQAALRAAMPALHRGVRHGIIHRNTAARKISRMSARVRTLG